MNRRCCILYNEPTPDAGPDELDVIDQVVLVEEQLQSLDIETYRKCVTRQFYDEIEEVGNDNPDFVFNLVESINNKGELGYFAPALLALSSLRYTGCPLEALFITSNKTLASRILSLGGVSTPFFARTDQPERLTKGKRYIIKPLWEDGSAGITSESVITWSDEMVSHLLTFSPLRWFVEEYIEGREFNISLFSGNDGPVVLPPAEMEFRNWGAEKPRIVDYKAKWEPESFEYKNSVRVFPDDIVASGLDRRLREIALKCWAVLELKGYARVDVRVDQQGIPYVLEVNGNPCISPDSGFIAAAGKGGFELKELFRCIISDLN